MLPRDRGTIVQVGSALAYRAIPLQAPYCAAKHAVQGFHESLRTELHDGSNVRVTMVQLPAHNTPQFSWGRAKLPRHPQPVPPIFQPEVAARRSSTRPSIGGERSSSAGPRQGDLRRADRAGLLDRYLASRGSTLSRRMSRSTASGAGNLFEPAPGDFAAHGRFDQRAKERSWLLEANLRRGRLVVRARGRAAVAGEHCRWRAC